MDTASDKPGDTLNGELPTSDPSENATSMSSPSSAPAPDSKTQAPMDDMDMD